MKYLALFLLLYSSFSQAQDSFSIKNHPEKGTVLSFVQTIEKSKVSESSESLPNENQEFALAGTIELIEWKDGLRKCKYSIDLVDYKSISDTDSILDNKRWNKKKPVLTVTTYKNKGGYAELENDVDFFKRLTYDISPKGREALKEVFDAVYFQDLNNSLVPYEVGTYHVANGDLNSAIAGNEKSNSLTKKSEVKILPKKGKNKQEIYLQKNTLISGTTRSKTEAVQVSATELSTELLDLTNGLRLQSAVNYEGVHLKLDTQTKENLEYQVTDKRDLKLTLKNSTK